MHRQRKYRLDRLQTARQDPANALATTVGRKHDSQNRLRVSPAWHGEGDADVAVHQAQPVVVARHQYRPTGIPIPRRLDQALGGKRCGDPLIESFHTPRATPQRAQYLEGAVRCQHVARPCVQVRGVGIARRASTFHDIEVMAVSLAIRQGISSAPAIDHQ